jgi:type I restriction enzyme S subunit
MKSWNEHRFGDLIEFPPKLSLRKGEVYPFIEMENIDSTCRFVASNLNRPYESSGASKFQTGDVLMARITPCLENGKIAQVQGRKKEAGFGSTEFFVFRAIIGKMDQGFLYYLVKSNFIWKSAVNSMVGASGRQRADAKFLKRVVVTVPEVPIQRKIAAILTAYDDLIETNKRRIALFEKMAEELYRDWFVRMRFPGHQNTRFVKGVPDGWEVRKTENAFEFTGGGTPSKDVSNYWSDGTVNWFTPSDITGAAGLFLSKSEDQCTDEGLARSSARLFPPYSVMMTSRATIGAIGINTTPACTNQGFITCIPNERYPLPYLYYWLKLAKPYFESLCGGATFPELTKGTFKKLEIMTPSEEVIKKFAKLSTPIFKSIQSGLEQNETLTKTRDLLLPRLISGKLSVEELDIQFPPSMWEETLEPEPAYG